MSSLLRRRFSRRRALTRLSCFCSFAVRLRGPLSDSPASATARAESALGALANARSLAAQIPEIIELRAPHTSGPHHLHGLERWRVNRKHALDTHTARHFADRESL